MLDFAVISTRYTVFNAQTLAREEVFDCFVEHHAQRVDIYPCSFGRCSFDKFHKFRPEYGITESFYLIVYQGTDGPEWYALAYSLVYLLQGVATVNVDIFLRVFTKNL